MPISPKQVEVFVRSSSRSDEVISYIDSILSTPNESNYRKGSSDQTVEEDYYYTFNYPKSLSTDEHEEIVMAYQDVGWPVVQVFDIEEGTQIRLFMNRYSKYFNS